MIQPDDTVICRQLLDGKTMTISRYQPDTDKEELVRSISLGDINNLQPGWKLLVGCGHSLSWSPDFTKLLVTGRTNQAEQSAQAGGFHVFLIDFSQTTITDLTAARQTSGFSAAAAVNDTMPGFVSETATNKVSIGSNMVMFSDNGIPKILNARSPKDVAAADVTPAAIKLHPEYRLWLQGGGEFNAVSPDGNYLFERGTGITPAGDYSAVGTACPAWNTRHHRLDRPNPCCRHVRAIRRADGGQRFDPELRVPDTRHW